MIDDVGGIDCQVLGIGSNGHIGFNEPGTSLASRTHMTNLTESTINDNARFFARRQDVPTKAITMGIGTILDAERVVLVANGAEEGRLHRQGHRRADHGHGPGERSPDASPRHLRRHRGRRLEADVELGTRVSREDYE